MAQLYLLMRYRLFLTSRTRSVFFSFITLLMMCKTSQAGNFLIDRFVFHDSIVVRILQSKKPPAFELYPDASHEILLFTAKGEKGKVYQLFLFDMEGKLIRQVQVHSKETTLLSGLTKGNFTFEILSDDERIGNGKIAVQ